MTSSKKRAATAVNRLYPNTLNPNIIEKCELLAALNTALAACLPTHLASHVQLMNLEGGILRLQCDDASFLMELKYLTPNVIAQLARATPFPIHQIEYKVMPRATKAQHRLPAIRKPSDKTQAKFKNSLSNIHDPDVKAAMERLSQSLSD